jgi:hypothetical protein
VAGQARGLPAPLLLGPIRSSPSARERFPASVFAYSERGSGHRSARLHQNWQQELERGRYQADRARRQYEAVEPENRLVARELESRWEEALLHLRRLEEEYARFQRELPAALTRAEREAIRALAHDIPEIWDAATTTPADRQVVIRHLIDRVRVQIRGRSEEVAVAIHWKGGFITQHALVRPVRRYCQLEGYRGLQRRLKELREAGQSAPAIAARLNDEGFRTPKGMLYTAQGVRTLLSRQGMSRSRAALKYPEGCGRDEWWIGDLARELGVSVNGMKGWIERGWFTPVS